MERLSDWKFGRVKDFAAVALAIGRAPMERRSAAELVDDRRLAMQIRSAMDGPAALQHTKAAPTGLDDDWVGTSREFITVVDQETLPGRLPMAHRLPFAVRTIAPGSAALAAWVADAGAKVVVEADFTEVIMPVRKCATIGVLTNEVIEASPVDAQQMVANVLTQAVRIAIDTAFVSDDAGTAATPPGLLYGAATIASSGSSATQIATDLAAMIAVASDAHIALSGAVWVMSPAAYGKLRMLKVADADGTVAGFPVLTSDAASGVVALIASQYVGIARSDRVAVTSTGHANLDMAGGNSPTYSLWQKNSTGVRVEAYANWATFGPSDSSGSAAVVSLTNASWA